MPHRNGQETNEFATILAEMKAMRKGLTAKLDAVAKKVDGVAVEVGTLRRDCMKLFEAVLAQEIELARTKDDVEALKAEVLLLKRGSTNGASPPSAA